MMKLSAFLLSLLITSPLYSLDFKVHANNSKTLNAVMASGIITELDTEKLQLHLASFPKKKNTAIYFDSPGGSLLEGIKLGRFFKNHKIKTVVQGDSICASACALAFLGGTDRKNNRWMSTTTTSKLGFHSFSKSDGSKKEDMDLTQSIVGEILEYGQFVEAPMKIFIHNFKTPSKSMYWFSTEESLSFGIKVWDIDKECFVGNVNCEKNKAGVSFLTAYFKKVKSQTYRSSWLKLSPRFRKNISFEQHQNWWSKKVSTVRLTELNQITYNKFEAKLYYELTNGKTYCSKDMLTLVNRNDYWLIDKQKTTDCKS